jgi:hypothetical protein
VNWRSFRLPEQILALISAAAVVVLFVTSAVDIHFFGIAQRVVAAFVLSWQLLASLGLSRARATESPSGQLRRPHRESDCSCEELGGAVRAVSRCGVVGALTWARCIGWRRSRDRLRRGSRAR